MTASNSERDEVLRKIEKLLNMTEAAGCTANEAENAARIAKRMLDKYQLSIADVERRSVGEEASRFDLPSTCQDWELELLHNVCLGLNCRVVRCKQQGVLSVFGHDSDTKVSLYFYFYLQAAFYGQAARAAKEMRKKLDERFMTSFIAGAAPVIRERLLETRRSPEASSDERGLVVLDSLKKEVVDKLVREHFPHLGHSSAGRIDPRVRGAGYAAGKSVSLHQGLTSARQGGSLKRLT